MAVNPVDIGVRSSHKSRQFRAAIGATAIRQGAIVKFTANLVVPAVATDVPFSTALFVAQESVDPADTAAPTDILIEPLADVINEMAYTTLPTLGTSYGLNDAYTVKTSDTTTKAVTVVKVDTVRLTAWVIGYPLAA